MPEIIIGPETREYPVGELRSAGSPAMVSYAYLQRANPGLVTITVNRMWRLIEHDARYGWWSAAATGDYEGAGTSHVTDEYVTDAHSTLEVRFDDGERWAVYRLEGFNPETQMFVARLWEQGEAA